MGGHVKWSPLGEMVASVNILEGLLKVSHTQSHQQLLNTRVSLPTNLAWHYRYPLVCTGDDTKLLFWKVLSK